MGFPSWWPKEGYDDQAQYDAAISRYQAEGKKVVEYYPSLAEVNKTSVPPTAVAQAGVGAMVPWLWSMGGKLWSMGGKALPWIAGGLAGMSLGDGNGGGGQSFAGSNVPLGGPGLAEPPSWMVAKEWSVNGAQFYKLIDGRIAVYSKKKGTWKVYRPAKHIVIPRDPKASQLLRADKKINALMSRLAKQAGFTRKKSSTAKKGRVAVPPGYNIINVD